MTPHNFTAAPRKQRWAVRTIRNGKARVLGHDYVPRADAPPLPEVAEGLRVMFAIYWTGDQRQDEFVYLWGTEEQARGREEMNFDPFVGDDGRLWWQWWYKA